MTQTNSLSSAGTQTRTANAANEITCISGSWIDPVYDDAGNMTSGPKAGDETTRLHYKYDAWNRLVQVNADDNGEPGTLIATYEYDGRNYRVSKDVAATSATDDFYYNESWQALEVRRNSDADPMEQYVWDQRYIDAPVVRWYDSNTDGTLDNTLYYTNDANMNVTGLVDASDGAMVEYSAYDPYGKPYFFDNDWDARAGSAYDNDLLFGGAPQDAETNQYLHRWRDRNWSVSWLTRDPVEDGISLYEYVSSCPVSTVDPSGLYGIDFHFYTIYYVLRAKCFSHEEAYNLAGWSQYTDDDGRTDAMGPDSNQRAKYHFPGSSPSKATVRNDPGARAQLEKSIAEYGKGGFGNSARLGVALHVFADSWGHEGFSGYWKSAINVRTGSWRPNIGHADAAQGGHAPDYPYNDVARAIECAKAIYDLLPDQCCSPQKALSLSEVVADLTQAFQVDAARYNRGFMEWVTIPQGPPAFMMPGGPRTTREWRRVPPTEREMIASIEKAIKSRFGATICYDKDAMVKRAAFDDYYKRALGL